jgi:hypothetical protein
LALDEEHDRSALCAEVVVAVRNQPLRRSVDEAAFGVIKKRAYRPRGPVRNDACRSRARRAPAALAPFTSRRREAKKPSEVLMESARTLA